MELKTQAEIEAIMYHGGIKAANARMTAAEAAGRAATNPYAKRIFSTFVNPLAAAIKEACEAKGARQSRAHVSLLRPLDPYSVAYITVNAALSALLKHGAASGKSADEVSGMTSRTLGKLVGKSVYGELVLAQVQAEFPDLFHILMQDLERKKSKNERHRLTVMRMQAEKHGMVPVEWPLGAQEQVGTYLLGLLEVCEMVEIGSQITVGHKTQPREVFLGAQVMAQIDHIREYVAKTCPMWGPCVEPPRDWTTTTDGGFHTPNMRRLHPTLVRGAAEVRELCRRTTMPQVLAAANALQRTPWTVNKRLLATITGLAGRLPLKEVVTADALPRPKRPEWLDTLAADEKPTDPARVAEFEQWKRAMAEWYTARKLLGSRVGRMSAAVDSAMRLQDYPAIYFVYFADSRGRFYPMTYGLNPQGSDMQKALLHFAEGKPVSTPSAIRWFLVQGANKWGFDKATLDERAAWVTERQALLLAFADDPLNNSGWTDAGDPLQFLAWCFEYAEWVRDRTGTFLSHLPVSMDGSCNGLQNLSAMMRDEVGGAATNLTPNTKMRDVYKDVADAAMVRLRAMSQEGENGAFVRKWLKHGISRSVVKRSVMTTPYGVTRQTAVKYVVRDYLAKGEFTEADEYALDRKEYRKAAEVLMNAVWPAIGDVIVKGREVMVWLKKAAPKIIKALPPDGAQIITWTAPSGFVAAQEYYEESVHRINTFLYGPVKIRVLVDSEDPDANRHANGMAPNFVHSMDAAHLHLTAAAAGAAGLHLAMIHDDYGTHAADADVLFRLIREQFVGMYEDNDPVQQFYSLYPQAGEPPSKGRLDIRGVLRSDFFFS